jgi:hypothetical protein
MRAAVLQERESIEEEKAQVDRYKQLLLKQRDIMILLTQRLNERDDQIVALQDELDAYDAHQKELEERMDEKTAQLIHLKVRGSCCHHRSELPSPPIAVHRTLALPPYLSRPPPWLVLLSAALLAVLIPTA